MEGDLNIFPTSCCTALLRSGLVRAGWCRKRLGRDGAAQHTIMNGAFSNVWQFCGIFEICDFEFVIWVIVYDLWIYSILFSYSLNYCVPIAGELMDFDKVGVTSCGAPEVSMTCIVRNWCYGRLGYVILDYLSEKWRFKFKWYWPSLFCLVSMIFEG